MDLPFDRTNIGLRERPVSSDLNRAQSQIYRTITDLMQQMFGGSATPRSGFIGPALSINALSPAAMSVQVAAGTGFLYDATDLPSDIGATDLEAVDDLSPYKPIMLNSPVTFAVPAAPAGPNTRIDIIEVRVNRLLVDSTPREQLDIPTKTFLPHSFFKTLSFSLDGFTGSVTTPAASTAALSYKIGAAGNPGVAPATTAGYIKLGEVHVGSAVTTIVAANLVDSRAMLIPRGAYLGRQIITATGTYTPSAGASRAVVRMVGGGGGAGGVAGGGPNLVAVSGGGASGRYLELDITGPGSLSGGAATIGAGGAGGAAGNNAGTAGGDTSILINGVTYVAKGGSATPGGTTHDIIFVAGATIPGGSSAADVAAGTNGGTGMGVASGALILSSGVGGNGGSNPLGTGGLGGSNANGTAGAGYGAGGGGAENHAAGNSGGGAGSIGVIIIDEYL